MFIQVHEVRFETIIQVAVDVAENKVGNRAPPSKSKPTKPSSPTNSSSHSGGNKDKHSKDDDQVADLVVDSTPTDLISTTSVERTVTSTGEETEITTNTAPIISPEKDKHPDTDGANLKFTPNEAWLDAVKSELPMNTIMR